MKKVFSIEIISNPIYEVEAENEEEAIEQAMQWYSEYEPEIRIADGRFEEISDLDFHRYD